MKYGRQIASYLSDAFDLTECEHGFSLYDGQRCPNEGCDRQALRDAREALTEAGTPDFDERTVLTLARHMERRMNEALDDQSDPDTIHLEREEVVLLQGLVGGIADYMERSR